jgi:hypothetical protein
MADHTGCVENTYSGSVCTTNADTDSRITAMMKVATPRDRRVAVGSSKVAQMRSRSVLGLAPAVGVGVGGGGELSASARLGAVLPPVQQSGGGGCACTHLAADGPP